MGFRIAPPADSGNGGDYKVTYEDVAGAFGGWMLVTVQVTGSSSAEAQMLFALKLRLGETANVVWEYEHCTVTAAVLTVVP